MNKSKIFVIVMSVLLFAVVGYSDQPVGMTGFESGVWIAPYTDTAPTGIGAGDLYVEGTVYSDKTFDLPLVGAFLDGTGVMGNDATTAPGMAEADSVPAIVYASSAEQVKCQWTFRVPADYVSGLGFRILMSSSSSASYADQSIDWQLWVNRNDVVFDAAAIAQDAVSPTSTTLATENEVIALTIDATGEAAITAGDFLTVDIWNAGTTDNTTEIKGIQGYYN